MKHLDLFSGIGGFALAARNVGWETVGFCEIDPYCQKVLAKHWPGVPIYEDVRNVRRYEVSDTGCKRVHEQGVIAKTGTGRSDGHGNGWDGIPCQQETKATGQRLCTDGTTTVGPIDIITGGFPCQDISYAGKGAGIDGERSGLWSELARIIGEVRPRYAVLENVAALLSRGLDRVAGDLAEIGYDCEWHCIPASYVGAPHRRDRIWIVAYPNSDAGTGPTGFAQFQREILDETGRSQTLDRPRAVREGSYATVADTDQPRLERRLREILRERARERVTRSSCDPWDGNWVAEPDVGRVANGIPKRMDRLRGLGNAIVPACAQVIFEAINEQTSR